MQAFRIFGRTYIIMKRNDKILIGIVLLAAVILGIGYTVFQKTGNYVIVQVDNEVYGTYSLAEDQKIVIGETNVLEIRDGQAFMIHADCPDQLCVNMKPIHESFELIVCLPNKVTVEVREK